MSAAVKVARARHQRGPSNSISSVLSSHPDPVQQVSLPQRPHHARRKSSKNDGHPISAIRSAFKRVLPKSWVSQKSYLALAMDFYSASIGLTAGVSLDNFTLTYVETVMLALELSHAVDTSNVLLIICEVTNQLLVVNTQILSNRIDAYPPDLNTVFVRKQDDTYTPCNHEDLMHLEAAFQFLKIFLRQSTRQVLQPFEFGWSPMETALRMGPLSAWLLEHPVVCMDSLDGVPSWHLRVRLEGYDPRYDHTFGLGSVPTSWVHGNKSFVSNVHGDAINLADIQDRLQTTMFSRLNNEVVWSELCLEWISHNGTALLDA